MKAYFIDFDSWIINGKDAGEAIEKAEKFIRQGKIPNISGADTYGEKHNDETYDHIKLNVSKNKISPIMLGDIDEITGDILEVLFPKLSHDTDKHDQLYTTLHNFLKERLDPWREGN